MTSPQVTAYLYQRVSTDDQDTARQHAENLAACARYGWSPREYSDDGIGASSRSRGKKAGAMRPDYRAMRRDILTASAGDVLVVHDVSRADRQLETWSALLADCRRTGVRVYVTGDDELYDPGKANHWRLLATAGINAESESLVKGDQIRSGIAYWRSQGHPQGRPTYGIARRRDPDKIRNRWVANVPDPQTGPVAARIVGAIAACVPYAEIARALNRDGIPTPRAGREWHSSVVAKIALHASDYAAVGIVTEETANAALARIAATAGMGRGSGTRAQTHRYSGCITCHRCQGMLAGAPHANGTIRYRCKQGCTSVDAGQVDTYLDAWAIARLSRPDAVALVTDSGQRKAAEDARRRASDLQAELDTWVTAGISARAYALKEREIMPQITAALADAQRAATVPALAGLADSDPGIVRARWGSLTATARKQAIRALAPRATMGPGKRGTGTPVQDRLSMG